MESEVSRKTSELDMLDQVINWDTYDCPDCQGTGEITDDFPDSTTYGEKIECLSCRGCGIVALIRKPKN